MRMSKVEDSLEYLSMTKSYESDSTMTHSNTKSKKINVDDDVLMSKVLNGDESNDSSRKSRSVESNHQEGQSYSSSSASSRNHNQHDITSKSNIVEAKMSAKGRKSSSTQRKKNSKASSHNRRGQSAGGYDVSSKQRQQRLPGAPPRSPRSPQVNNINNTVFMENPQAIPSYNQQRDSLSPRQQQYQHIHSYSDPSILNSSEIYRNYESEYGADLDPNAPPPGVMVTSNGGYPFSHHTRSRTASSTLGNIAEDIILNPAHDDDSEDEEGEGLPVGAVNVPSQGASVFSARNELMALTKSPKSPNMFVTQPQIQPLPQTQAHHQYHFYDNYPSNFPGNMNNMQASLHHMSPHHTSPSKSNEASMLDSSNHSLPNSMLSNDYNYDRSSLDGSNHSMPTPSQIASFQQQQRARSFSTGVGARQDYYSERSMLDNSNHSLPQSFGAPTTPHSSYRKPSFGNGSVFPTSSEMSPLMSSPFGAERSMYSTQSNGTSNASIPTTPNTANTASSQRRRRESHRRRMHRRQKSLEKFMEEVKGQEQSNSCNDVFFALIFILHLSVMIYLGITYGPNTMKNETSSTGSSIHSEADITFTYKNIVNVACVCSAFAVILSTLSLLFMSMFANKLIQSALVVSIGLAFAWGTIGIGLSPTSVVPATGIIALALTIGYTFVVWDRVPFASANLSTALAGLLQHQHRDGKNENNGYIHSRYIVASVAFLSQALLLAWTIFYLITFIGVYDAIVDKKLVFRSSSENACRVLVYMGMAISYYWTFQVISHVVQVTVAGIIRCWWFQPPEKAIIMPSLEGSLSKKSEATTKPVDHIIRATIFSFGSICKGSLFVGFVQVLGQVTNIFCPKRHDSSLSCVADCLRIFQECTVSTVDLVSSKINPWAFTYVGMYGYKFSEAGEKATELFEKRGWSRIVTDDLIPNILFMVSIVIGGVTGCVGLLVESIDGFHFSSFNQPTVTAFSIGVCVGITLSYVLFSVIGSSVNAVIVCFAGSPVEFQENHSDLSRKLRSAWREVWPGCMDVTDTSITYYSAHNTSIHSTSIRNDSPARMMQTP